jgi:hypothetical protein
MGGMSVTGNLNSARREHALPGTERSFGLSVGAVLVVIGALLVWRDRPLRGEVLGSAGALLMLFGLIWPALLKQPRVWWWRIARPIGDFNARVLLTLLFFLVLTPLGIIWRLIGTDPLARRRKPAGGWQPYPGRYRDSNHYQRMY